MKRCLFGLIAFLFALCAQAQTPAAPLDGSIFHCSVNGDRTDLLPIQCKALADKLWAGQNSLGTCGYIGQDSVAFAAGSVLYYWSLQHYHCTNGQPYPYADGINGSGTLQLGYIFAAPGPMDPRVFYPNGWNVPNLGINQKAASIGYVNTGHNMVCPADSVPLSEPNGIIECGCPTVTIWSIQINTVWNEPWYACLPVTDNVIPQIKANVFKSPKQH